MNEMSCVFVCLRIGAWGFGPRCMTKWSRPLEIHKSRYGTQILSWNALFFAFEWVCITFPKTFFTTRKSHVCWCQGFVMKYNKCDLAYIWGFMFNISQFDFIFNWALLGFQGYVVTLTRVIPVHNIVNRLKRLRSLFQGLSNTVVI